MPALVSDWSPVSGAIERVNEDFLPTASIWRAKKPSSRPYAYRVKVARLEVVRGKAKTIEEAKNTVDVFLFQLGFLELDELSDPLKKKLSKHCLEFLPFDLIVLLKSIFPQAGVAPTVGDVLRVGGPKALAAMGGIALQSLNSSLAVLEPIGSLQIPIHGSMARAEPLLKEPLHYGLSGDSRAFGLILKMNTLATLLAVRGIDPANVGAMIVAEDLLKELLRSGGRDSMAMRALFISRTSVAIKDLETEISNLVEGTSNLKALAVFRALELHVGPDTDIIRINTNPSRANLDALSYPTGSLAVWMAPTGLYTWANTGTAWVHISSGANGPDALIKDLDLFYEISPETEGDAMSEPEEKGSLATAMENHPTLNLFVGGGLDSSKMVAAVKSQKLIEHIARKIALKLLGKEHVAVLDTPGGDILVSICMPLAIHLIATEGPKLGIPVPGAEALVAISDAAFRGQIVRIGLQYGPELTDIFDLVSEELGELRQLGSALIGFTGDGDLGGLGDTADTRTKVSAS